MSRASLVCTTLFVIALTVLSVPLPREEVPICPSGAEAMLRPDGEPRKCLPHQSHLCLNALDDGADPNSVCCWHNKVDYYCCRNVAETQCPAYSNVTVVIHNSFPQNSFPIKTFHFRKGIEKDLKFSQK
ncbi:unnamed protein product [Bursaphelenchus okinawaensis]|uniref:Uncharacterized protein n=1 Tax=Bursaphelenchus okinawaensis TaxID=465554 RepID=A0A811KTH3_9BILA|nr:unnamed protein product [Bursaphelenchus okinawaensis]CAG9110963.1 unnamed protein product [Bursaphelenchus okinawaensis]